MNRQNLGNLRPWPYQRAKDIGRVVAGKQRWHIDWTDSTGRHSRTVWGDQTDAARAAERIAQRIAVAAEPAPPAPTLPHKPANCFPPPPTGFIPEPAAALLSPQRLADDFRDWLRNRARSQKHWRDTHRQVVDVLRLAGIGGVGEIDEDRVLGAIAAMMNRPRRPIGRNTANHYIAAMKGFTAWLDRRGLVGRDPLRHLERYRAAADVRHQRRALTPAELSLLVRTTLASERAVYGIAPADRAALYVAGASIPVRAGALRALRVEQFAFTAAGGPHLVTQGSQEKSGKGRIIELPEEPAAYLGQYLAGKLPAARAFRMPHPCSVVRMLRCDLAAAGIGYCTLVSEGGVKRRLEVADFHSLRRSHATWLAQRGVLPKDLQRQMGHSSTEVTMQHYVDVQRQDARRAVERFPSLSLPPASLPAS